MSAIHESLSTALPRLADLTGYDALAALYLIICWLGIGWWVEDRPHNKSASTLMFTHRMAWMHPIF